MSLGLQRCQGITGGIRFEGVVPITERIQLLLGGVALLMQGSIDLPSPSR